MHCHNYSGYSKLWPNGDTHNKMVLCTKTISQLLYQVIKDTNPTANYLTSTDAFFSAAEYLKNGTITMPHCETGDMLPDPLTKAMDIPTTISHIAKLSRSGAHVIWLESNNVMRRKTYLRCHDAYEHRWIAKRLTTVSIIQANITSNISLGGCAGTVGEEGV